MRIIIRLASLEQYDYLSDEEHLEKVERYVILMYDRTSDLHSVNVDDIFLQRRTDQVRTCPQHWTHWNSI